MSVAPDEQRILTFGLTLHDDDTLSRRPAATDDNGSARFDAEHPRFRGEREGDQFAGASGLVFEQAMAQTRMAVCLCDPKQPDIPIIFANRAFRDLTIPRDLSARDRPHGGENALGGVVLLIHGRILPTGLA